MSTTSSQSNYSFTEKKRVRKDFGKRGSILEVPFLLAIQVDSYREFLQANTDPAKRADRGLHAALKSVFPIVSYNGYAALEYVGYKLGDPVFDERECRQRGMSYRSEVHTSELQSLMRHSYAVFCLKKKTQYTTDLKSPLNT